ncbi:MAG: hypothetical protein ACE5H9_00960 [Anaerolineae bacterium]
MQVPGIIRPSMISLPPLHTWPSTLKRIVLILATLVCLAAYGLLVGGVVGGMLLLLNVSFG